jgi:hypothetical protein
MNLNWEQYIGPGGHRADGVHSVYIILDEGNLAKLYQMPDDELSPLNPTADTQVSRVRPWCHVRARGARARVPLGIGAGRGESGRAGVGGRRCLRQLPNWTRRMVRSHS